MITIIIIIIIVIIEMTFIYLSKVHLINSILLVSRCCLNTKKIINNKYLAFQYEVKIHDQINIIMEGETKYVYTFV